MRLLFTTWLLTLTSAAALAQATEPAPADHQSPPADHQSTADTFRPHTLASGHVSHHGFFVAPSVQLGPAIDDQRLWTGGRVAYQMNHRVAVGVAGFGLVAPPRLTAPLADGTRPRLQAGYGGVLLEYTIAPAGLVHVSIPVLVGAGGAGYTTRDIWDDHDPLNEDNFRSQDAFFVVEPAVQAELNLTPFLRLTGGAGYRYVEGLHLEQTTSAALTGWTFTLGLKGGLL